MSASLRMRFGVAAAGLSCLIAGYGLAQQQAGPELRSGAGQNDRSAKQQDDRSATPTTRGNRYQSTTSERRTANFRGPQTTSGAQGQELDRYLANCLLIKNQGEVKINQFAQQHAQNPEVKEFAQQMVKDHQQFVGQLQKLAAAEGAPTLGATPSSDFERSTTDTTTLPGSPGARAKVSATDSTTATPSTTNESSSTTDRSTGAASGALSQLVEIDRKINDKVGQATQEELQQKSGAEFDECYLGAQIGAHIHMQAALEVLAQESQGQLKQVAEQARPIVQEHLDRAKELAKQMKSSGSARQAERTSTSRTQQ
jgi:predicted outer membrane protein